MLYSPAKRFYTRSLQPTIYTAHQRSAKRLQNRKHTWRQPKARFQMEEAEKSAQGGAPDVSYADPANNITQERNGP